MSDLPPPPPPFEGQAADATVDTKAQRPWWKKKRFIIPIILVVLIIAASAGGGGDDDKKETASDIEDVAEEVTTTTTEKPATTTTARQTTTTAAPSAETLEAAWASTFDENRPDLIDAIETDFSFDSVDRVEYNAELDRVEVAVTAGWGTVEYMLDDAWELTKAMSTFWESDGPFVEGVFVPGMLVTVDDASKICAGEFMLRLGDVRADKEAFMNEC